MPENQPPSGTPPTPSQPAAPAPDQKERETRTWNMWCHMSALGGLVVPAGNVLGPLLIWQIKKNEFPSVEAHGKAALNFQLTVLIAALAGLVLTMIPCAGLLFIPVLIAIAVCGLVFAIIAGLKANDGVEYKYPWSLPLIK